MRENNIIIIISTLFIIIGSGFLFGANYIYMSSNDFIENSALAQGIIIDNPVGADGKYSYLVEFSLNENKIYSFKSNVRDRGKSYEKGDIVEVLYSIEKPYEAKINSISTLWGGAFVLGFSGVIFIFLGGVGLINALFNTNKTKHISSYE